MKTYQALLAIVIVYAIGILVTLQINDEGRVAKCIVDNMRHDGVVYAYPNKLDEYDAKCRHRK